MMTLQPTTRVWRYMSFAKFVWMLQKKQLWLSSAELLDDKWELMPDSQQLNYIINNRPASLSAEATTDRVAAAVKALRKNTFINCWTASEHESHALWRIYCPSPEGVAIQTTFDRLKQSVGLPIGEVVYTSNEVKSAKLDAWQLVIQKRPMFAYEQEVRVVLVQDYTDPEHPERRTVGTRLNWDPELHLENIWVHPESEFWFIETVTETVRRLAPKLCDNGLPRVWYSNMSSQPPF
jgi:hypothetical protein